MLRAIRPGDCQIVAALIRGAFAVTEIPVEPLPSALRVTAETVAEHLRAGGGGALAGTEGCVLWRPDAGGFYVSRLAVRPDRRGRGIGAALLGAAEDAAREAGATRLHLETRLALAANRRLFRRAGFVECGTTAHPGYDAPTSVSLEKLLADS